MSGDSDQSVEVSIYNETYRVRSGGDPEYVKQLAQYVDARMKEVFESTPTVDSLKVAVLVALNIADDYFSTKEELSTLDEAVRSKSENMIALLEPFVNSTSP